MAERTIYECDRCHTEWEPENHGDFPPQWSVTQSLGVTRFILCEACTAIHRRFLEGSAVPGLPPPPILPTPPVPPLLDEADHTSDETAP